MANGSPARMTPGQPGTATGASRAWWGGSTVCPWRGVPKHAARRELAVETDTMEETGMCRFTVADKVPAHRLMRCHTRADIGVPVVAWRPNDGSGQWDGLRPPEGIAAPATAILDRGSKGQWTLRFLSPYRCETVTVEERTYPLAASFTAPIAKLVRQAGPLRRSGFRGMLNSSGVSCREKLYLMQPYDPDRIPLLNGARPAVDCGLLLQFGQRPLRRSDASCPLPDLALPLSHRHSGAAKRRRSTPHSQADPSRD
jgi:hypothetical protein